MYNRFCFRLCFFLPPFILFLVWSSIFFYYMCFPTHRPTSTTCAHCIRVCACDPCLDRECYPHVVPCAPYMLSSCSTRLWFTIHKKCTTMTDQRNDKQSPPASTKVPKSVSDRKRFFENAMEDHSKPAPKTGKWQQDSHHIFFIPHIQRFSHILTGLRLFGHLCRGVSVQSHTF